MVNCRALQEELKSVRILQEDALEAAASDLRRLNNGLAEAEKTNALLTAEKENLLNQALRCLALSLPLSLTLTSQTPNPNLSASVTVG